MPIKSKRRGDILRVGVVITAICASSTAAHAAPVVIVTPSVLNFGSMLIGTGSRDMMFVVDNKGDEPAPVISGFTLSGPGARNFVIRYSNCVGASLPPGKACGTIIKCIPVDVGLNTAVVSTEFGTIDAPLSVALQVIGIGTEMSLQFGFTGADQLFAVPSGVSSIQVKMWGAGAEAGFADLGGLDCESMPGGGGGFASATLSVSPGELLTVRVGGAPVDFTDPGWPNGGRGWLDQVKIGRRLYTFGAYGGGGGSSMLLRNGIVALEAGGGNGGLPCELPLAGGGDRTCPTPGGQKGTDLADYGTAGGGGYCGGGPSVPGSSFVPSGGVQEPGWLEYPGASSDPDRQGAGQGGYWLSATHGRVEITWTQ